MNEGQNAVIRDEEKRRLREARKERLRVVLASPNLHANARDALYACLVGVLDHGCCGCCASNETDTLISDLMAALDAVKP